MDMLFEYLLQDMKILLAVAVACAAIAVAALWKVVADLRRKAPGDDKPN